MAVSVTTVIDWCVYILLIVFNYTF